jgi:clan AA aspartic protease
MTPTADVEVRGSRGAVRLTGIIDTAFEGEICLPKTVAVGLGLELLTLSAVELADGTQKEELVFGGSVHFLDKQWDVHIYLSDSDDTLLGTALLADCRLVIDFPTGRVRVTRPRTRRRKRRTGS